MTNSRQNNTEPGQGSERLAFWGFLAVVVLCSLGVWVAEAGAQSTFIDPTAYGSPLWQGAVADEDALDVCDGDTADTIHWLVDEAAVAYCPADGSDWEINEFSGGGGGSGTVESVAMTVPTGFTLSGSPITTTGTFALGLSTQAAGRVWAGPTSGADATPGFRALVAADIPALSYLTDITGQTIGDLSDVSAKSGTGTVVVTTTGAQTSGDCVEIDASGNHVASGSACGGGGGAVSIADLTSGTNTTMAGVIGSGASLAVSGSGTIAATTATSATNAAGIDSDADGTREVWVATVSTHPSVCLGPGDAGTCQARLSNYSGGSLYAPFVFGGGLFLGTSADAAESQWWARPLTSTRLQITNMVYATSLEIGHDGTRPYFSLYGAVYYGASATPPTCSTDGSVYTDTTEGSGLAAQCVCLDGTWEVMAGAGGCGTP